MARLREVTAGDLAVVLLGAGAEEQARMLARQPRLPAPAHLLHARLSPGLCFARIYAEATALVFPSLCEAFGIPAVEAMAQGLPVALADSTALPEIGGAAGWYFDPTDEDAITAAVRGLLDRPEEKARRVALGRAIAERYRWNAANELLVQAMLNHR